MAAVSGNGFSDKLQLGECGVKLEYGGELEPVRCADRNRYREYHDIADQLSSDHQRCEETWTINGTGSLAVSNAVKLDRHNAFINVNFILCSNTVFGPGAYIGDQNTPPLIEGIWLTGGLSGSGPLAVQGNGSVGYQNNAAPIFTGGTMISGGSYVNWVMTNIAGSYAFGFDAGGVNPGTITISNNGTFGLAAFTAAGTPQEIGLTNPIVVAGTGGSLFGCEGTNTHVTYSGNLTLNAPLILGDALGWDSAALPSDSSTPALSISGSITLKRYARAAFLGNDTQSRSVNISGNVADEVSLAPTPLLLSSGQANGEIITLANPAVGGNTYAGGTVIDYCGNANGKNTANSRAEVLATARLGVGNLSILPGGRIRLDSPQNVTNTAMITVNGNSLSSGVLGLAFNSVPANITNAGSGTVLAIDTTNAFTAITNLSMIGNGTLFVGTTLQTATLTPSTGTLLPGQGNVYRLGGGGTYGLNASCSPGTLTVNAQLADYGNTALQVGQNTWQGQGMVTLTQSNSFKGQLDVWGPSLWYNNASSYNAYCLLYGTPLVSQNAYVFGDANGAVNLHGAGIQLSQSSEGSATSVTKGHLTFEGRCELNDNAYYWIMAFTLGIDASSRTNGGILVLHDIRGSQLQQYERIIVAGGGTPPGYANGMAAPYLIVNDNDFAAYDTTVLNGFIKGFTNFGNYVSLPAGGGAGVEVVSVGASSLTTNYNIYALKTTGSLTSDGVADRTLTIGSGGLILNGNIGANGTPYQVNLNFGSAEGILYDSSNNPYIYGKISGSGGLTVVSKVNVGPIYLMNTNNDFTGTITINPVGIQAVFDSATSPGSLGSISNSLYFNGGLLFRNGGDRLLPSHTLTMGPLGGRIYGNGANAIIMGQITGPGNLTVVNSTVILANDTTQGQSANNYAGGTRVLFNGIMVVSNNVSMGSGDLVIEANGMATLMGNANLAATARAHVPCLATLALAAPAPSFGNITGGGNIVLGQGSTPKNDTTLTIGGDNSSSTFYGLISEVSSTVGSGKGSLTKTGLGTLTLSGTQTYTGPTTVNNGTLVLLGAVASNLTVGSGATLQGYGLIGGNLTNNGTMAMGLSTNQAVTMSVGGNLVLNSGSTLAVNMEGATNDVVNVAGNVTINGGTLVLNGPKLVLGTTLTLINATGTVTQNTPLTPPDGYSIRTDSSGKLLQLVRRVQGFIFITR